MFRDLDLDPGRLRPDDIRTLPLTPKDALRADPDAFVRRSARPYLRAMTTGTTGAATSVYFSQQELRAMAALSALAFLFHRQIEPEDVVQISTSSRAVLGNLGLAGAAERIGAVVYHAGIVDPPHSLSLLSQERSLRGKLPRASVLSTYPSYLGELVEHGHHLGYGPADFGLRRILLGGEIVTEGLRTRATKLFGPVEFVEGYAMTETIPFGGNVCSQGHLHFEPSQGLPEVLNPGTGTPVLPGETGTLVATPFPPFRDTTILLRYDTQDVVRVLPQPPACEMSHLTATSNILGKLRFCVRHETGWAYQRDVLEAVEGVDEVPMPGRCGFWEVPGGVAVEAVAPEDSPRVRRELGDRLEERGVPLRDLRLVASRSELQHPLPVRCDLKESAIGPAPEVTRMADAEEMFR